MTAPVMPESPEARRRRLAREGMSQLTQRPDASRVGTDPDYEPGMLRPSLPMEMVGGMVSYARENPLRAALDFTPVGDALSLKDAAGDLRRGDYGSAAINSLAAIPIVGSVAPALKGGAKGVKAAAVASRPARGVTEILDAGAAPAARVVEDWKPTSRGIFDREELQDMQGTVASDARLVPPVGPRASSSMLTDAITTSPEVRAGLRADAERGLRMGGDRWYDLSPIRRYIEERGTPEMMSFEDFNRVGAGASMQNSVPSEISASSILNFARKRGLPLEEAKQIFLRETGTDLLPMLTGMHRSVGEKAIDAGALLPEDPFGANWKVPMYADKRLGGGGTLDVDAPGALPALDTHEKRRILQLARQDPKVAKLMRELGVFDEDHVPVINSADYRELGGMYVDAAREMGLPTAGTFQAGRWVGGWDQTGLKSPPFGDYTQILEDLITYSAQRRGMPSDPESLKSYFDRVLQGDDFIVPFTGKGAIPVRPQGR